MIATADARPTPSSGPASSPGSRRRRGRRIVGWVLGVLAFVILVNLALGVVNASSGDTAHRGPDGSSFVTTDRGLGAFRDLAGVYGYHTERSLVASAGGLESGATAVVWSPDPARVDRATADNLRAFVDAGGRLLIATTPQQFAQTFDVGLPLDPGSADTVTGLVRAPERRVPAVAGPPETEGVREVLTADRTAFAVGPEGTTLLGTASTAAAATYRFGSGTIVYVVAPSILENEFLDRADNARFGLGALGSVARPVVFVERVHGYSDEGEGLDAIPTGWKIALIGLIVGVMLVILAAGRRVGPPEDLTRPLPPPRDAYVRSLAVSLANTGRPDATFAPTQEIVRRRLARRTRLPEGASVEALRAAALGLGWAPDEIDALFEPIHTPARAAALSRAAARLAGPEPAEVAGGRT